MSWAPHELGAIVACASSDGKLSVLTFKSTSQSQSTFADSFYYVIFSDDGTWGADIFNGHAIGCNAVSWAPATLLGSLITPQQQQPTAPGGNPDQPAHATVKRFASAGCDNLVKIWGFRCVLSQFGIT